MSFFRTAMKVLILTKQYRNKHAVWPNHGDLSEEYGLPCVAISRTFADLSAFGLVHYLPKFGRWSLTRAGEETFQIIYKKGTRIGSDGEETPRPLLHKKKKVHPSSIVTIGGRKNDYTYELHILLLINRYKKTHGVYPSRTSLSKEYNLPWSVVGYALVNLLSREFVRYLPKSYQWVLTKEGRATERRMTCLAGTSRSMSVARTEQ